MKLSTWAAVLGEAIVAGQWAKPFTLAQTSAPTLYSAPSASLQSLSGVLVFDISSASSVLTSCLALLAEVTVTEGAGNEVELLNLRWSIFFLRNLRVMTTFPPKHKDIGPGDGRLGCDWPSVTSSSSLASASDRGPRL
jgi:hypothetical protein